MMRISYKLTKRTTKTKKSEKPLKILKMYMVIIFKTIRYRLTASDEIVHSNLSNKLMRPLSILQLHEV